MKIDNTIILIEDRPTAEFLVIKAKLAQIGFNRYTQVWEVYNTYFPGENKTSVMQFYTLAKKVNEKILSRFREILEKETEKVN